MVSNRVENYLILMKIRQKAFRRNTTISGGIFLMTFLMLITLGMIGSLNASSIYLLTMMVALFGLAYLMSWVKLENLKNSIELIDHLLTKKEE